MWSFKTLTKRGPGTLLQGTVGDVRRSMGRAFTSFEVRQKISMLRLLGQLREHRQRTRRADHLREGERIAESLDEIEAQAPRLVDYYAHNRLKNSSPIKKLEL